MVGECVGAVAGCVGEGGNGGRVDGCMDRLLDGLECGRGVNRDTQLVQPKRWTVPDFSPTPWGR